MAAWRRTAQKGTEGACTDGEARECYEGGVLPFSKKARRNALRARPTPEHWRAIVDQNVPYARLLDEADRRELKGDDAPFHVHRRQLAV